MKKLVIVVVVLAVILLVAPYGIGRMAESRVNKGLDKLLEQAPYLKISERRWTTGWFKSEQVLTIELSDSFADAFGKKMAGGILQDESAAADAAMDAEGTEQADMPEAPMADSDTPDAATPPDMPAEMPMKITVKNDVLHGPVLGLSGFGLARVDTHLELSEDVRRKIQEVFGPKPALEMSTRIGFFGGGTTTFQSEGRKLASKDDDTEVTYETFKLAVGVSKNGDSYDVDGKLPSVVAKSKAGEHYFTMTDLTLDGDGKRVMGELYDGEFAFRIKEMKIKDPNAADGMSIEDVHYVVDTRTKDDFVNMSAQVGSGEVKSKQFSMMGFEVKEIHYNFSLRHLHAPTLEKLVVSMRDMYTTPLNDPENAEAAIFAPLKEHGAELLKRDPEFGIDRVGLVTADGEIVAKGVIKLLGATPEDFSGGSPMALVGKLDADITITADIKAVEKFPNGAAAVGGAVESGYATKEGDQLVCKITFKSGQLLVNGKPAPIPGLGGPPQE